MGCCRISKLPQRVSDQLGSPIQLVQKAASFTESRSSSSFGSCISSRLDRPVGPAEELYNWIRDDDAIFSRAAHEVALFGAVMIKTPQSHLPDGPQETGKQSDEMKQVVPTMSATSGNKSNMSPPPAGRISQTSSTITGHSHSRASYGPRHSQNSRPNRHSNRSIPNVPTNIEGEGTAWPSYAQDDDPAEVEQTHADKALVISQKIDCTAFCEVVHRKDFAQPGLAVCCRKARKPGCPNQDNVFLCQSNGMSIIGVADGHGDFGHWVSHWVARYAIALVLTEVCVEGKLPSDFALARIFNLCHEALELRGREDGFSVLYSGCTMTICLVEHKRREVIAAWVGDSRAILGRERGSQAEEITFDHKPGHSEERRRIFQSRGHIQEDESSVKRVALSEANDGHGLAITRSVGDTAYHSIGVIHQPSIKRIQLDEVAGEPTGVESRKDFVLVGSDGVWDAAGFEDVASIVGQAGPEGAGTAVQKVVRQAHDRWIADALSPDDNTDDISALAVWL